MVFFLRFKTGSVARAESVSAQLVPRLRAWKLKSRFTKHDDLVFPNSKGNHVGHNNLVKRRFCPVVREAESRAQAGPAQCSRSSTTFQLARAPALRSVMLN